MSQHAKLVQRTETLFAALDRTARIGAALSARAHAHLTLTGLVARSTPVDVDTFRDWANELDYQNAQLVKLGHTAQPARPTHAEMVSESA